MKGGGMKQERVGNDDHEQRYVSLGFFRTVANAYGKSLRDPSKFIEAQGQPRSEIDHRNLICWGPADVLTVSVCRSPDLFLRIQQAYPPNNNVYEVRYCFGALYQPKTLSLTMLDNLPLVGITFLKFESRLHYGLKRTRAMNLLQEVIWQQMSDYARRAGNISVALMVSYGWEDLVLVSCADRYDAIKRLVFQLRRDLRFQELKSYLKDDFFSTNPKASHVVATTHTTLAAWLPHSTTTTMAAQISRVRKRMSRRDTTVVDSLELQIRPGHLDWIRAALPRPRARCRYSYSPGRYDITLRFPSMPVRDYFKFYFLELRPLLERKDSPVISTRTTFRLNAGAGYAETQKECGRPIRTQQFPTEDRRIVERLLRTSLLPIHGTAALLNTALSSWYLENSFYIRAGMESLVQAIKVVSTTLASKGRELGRRSGNRAKEHRRDALRNLQTVAAEGILPLLEQCYRDRFRGAYPLGEGLGTPLLSYKGSFQKHLILVDRICHAIHEFLSRTAVPPTRGLRQKQVFCSCISSSSSPAVFPYSPAGFNLAILQIPLDSLFTPSDLYYLFHEVGHVLLYDLGLPAYIYSSLAAHLSRRAKRERRILELYSQFDDMLELVENILCDYVLLTVGFDGDSRRFKRYLVSYDRKLGKGRPTEEISLRVLTANALLEVVVDAEPLRASFAGIRHTTPKDGQAWPDEWLFALDYLETEMRSAAIMPDVLQRLSSCCQRAVGTRHYSALRRVKDYFTTGGLREWVELLYR
jgi:hypothetical protein